MFSKTLIAAATVLALSVPAKADLEVGMGVFCDRQDQADLLLKLYADTKDLGEVIEAVNTKFHNPAACMGATAAFTRESEVRLIRNWNEVLHVRAVVVHAVYANAAPQVVSPFPQIMVEIVKETGI